MTDASGIHRLERPGVVQPIRFFLRLGPKRVGLLLRDTLDEWNNDNISRLAAALAYYTLFSLAPLLIVVISTAGLIFGEAAVRGQIVYQIEYLIGTEGAKGVQTMLQSAAQPDKGLAAVLGLVTLFFGASLVVSQLRNSLNVIWKVSTQDTGGLLADVMNLLRQRLFAFLLVLGTGFLMLVSLVINAVIAALGKYFQEWLPTSEGWLQWITFVAWFLVTTVVFGLIYKVLPDAEIAWGDVVIGAAMTSLLFTGGKLLIALYLGKTSLASAYGAAGSIIIILVWVYYSAHVFFFGAEFTHVYANKYGSQLVLRHRNW
jgi:membrane protein